MTSLYVLCEVRRLSILIDRAAECCWTVQWHWWHIFSHIISNSKHILQQFLHDRTTTYSLRSRNHSKAL